MNTTMNYVAQHCGTIDMSKLPRIGRKGKRGKRKPKASRQGAASVPPPRMGANKLQKTELSKTKPNGDERIAACFAKGVPGGNRPPIKPLISIDKNGKRWAMGVPGQKGDASVSEMREDIKQGYHEAREADSGLLPDINNKSPEESLSDVLNRQKHKPRISLAQKAKERYDSSVNTRSIRCLISKPGAMLDADQVEAELLSADTGFHVKKIKELRRLFRAAVKRDPGLTPGPFKKVMATFGIRNERMVGRVFDVLDEFRTKHLTFQQFVNCIHLFLKGSRVEQAQVLFKMIDESDDRMISRLEMLHFFAGGLAHRDEKKLVASIVDEMMELIDVNKSGEVSFDEFVLKVANDDDVWSCFQSVSPLTQLIKAMNFGVET